MPFPALPAQPPRRWLLWGYAEDGKSTFAARFRRPALVLDADHRFAEVAAGAPDVYSLSTNPADLLDVPRIRRLLAEHMPGSGIRSIIVDSLTSLAAPLLQEATLNAASPALRNKSSAFKDKAVLLRLLADSVNAWGTDVLWIAHYESSIFNGQRRARRSLPDLEVERLRRSHTLELSIVRDGARRGLRLDHARSGAPPGLTVWDTSVAWENMPDRIEAALAGGKLPARAGP